MSNEPDTTESLIRIDTTVGMDEVAAIKVAEVEHNCLARQEELRAGLKKAEAHVQKLEAGLGTAIDSDTRDEHPEIAKIETLLKSFFGKEARLVISSNGPDNKVRVQVGVPVCILPLKGAKSKAIMKEVADTRKDISDAENNLCTVKKQLGMLPHLERSAKAAVAKARLMQSDAGRNLLAQMDKVALPGLPAPKAK